MLEIKNLGAWGRSFLSLLADLVTVYPPASALGASLLSSVLASMLDIPLILRVGIVAVVFILALFSVRRLVRNRLPAESEPGE